MNVKLLMSFICLVFLFINPINAEENEKKSANLKKNMKKFFKELKKETLKIKQN